MNNLTGMPPGFTITTEGTYGGYPYQPTSSTVPAAVAYGATTNTSSAPASQALDSSMANTQAEALSTALNAQWQLHLQQQMQMMAMNGNGYLSSNVNGFVPLTGTANAAYLLGPFDASQFLGAMPPLPQQPTGGNGQATAPSGGSSTSLHYSQPYRLSTPQPCPDPHCQQCQSTSTSQPTHSTMGAAAQNVVAPTPTRSTPILTSPLLPNPDPFASMNQPARATVPTRVSAAAGGIQASAAGASVAPAGIPAGAAGASATTNGRPVSNNTSTSTAGPAAVRSSSSYQTSAQPFREIRTHKLTALGKTFTPAAAASSSSVVPHARQNRSSQDVPTRFLKYRQKTYDMATTIERIANNLGINTRDIQHLGVHERIEAIVVRIAGLATYPSLM